MHISATAPADWSRRVSAPALSQEFAEAMTTVGWRPFYAADEGDAALVFVRRLPVPGLSAWTARAKVYLNHGYEGFLRRLLATLADNGVGYVRVGDTRRPLPDHLRCALREMTVFDHHVVLHDARLGDEAWLAGMEKQARAAVRKAVRAGVVVTEVATEAELRDYCQLAAETAARMRRRDVVAALPPAFFSAIFRSMVPRGQALFLLARAGDAPLAGALLLKSPDRLKYLHGVSTRSPELAPSQGPAALVWHALQLARREGIPCFDHGGVTVTDDPSHPHHPVYLFKRRFGGRVEPAPSGDIILSPMKHAFQQRVMAPLWKRLHPLYMRLAGARLSFDA
jgi:hypothetical protein